LFEIMVFWFNIKIVSIVSMGYPKGKAMPYGKRNLEDVLHWERF